MVCFCAAVSATCGAAPLSSAGVWANTAPAAIDSAASEMKRRTELIIDRSRLTYVHAADSAITHDPSLSFQKVPRDNQGETVANYQQWCVTEHVREKFSCRSCQTITQPPAPFHVIARGFAGPSLLAMILVEKYANH